MVSSAMKNKAENLSRKMLKVVERKRFGKTYAENVNKEHYFDQVPNADMREEPVKRISHVEITNAIKAMKSGKEVMRQLCQRVLDAKGRLENKCGETNL